MKARVINYDNGVYILYSNGIIKNVKGSNKLGVLFRNFKQYSTIEPEKGKRWDKEILDMTKHEGETIAYLTDNLEFVVLDPSYIMESLEIAEPFDHLMSVEEYGRALGKSAEAVKKHLRNNAIEGAGKPGGRDWLIPKTSLSKYPEDNRIIHGKFIGLSARRASNK